MTSLWSRVSPAELALVQAGMNEVPVRVGGIARSLGLDVNRAVLEPRVSGLIRPSATARSGYEIQVNKFESKGRQRFTVAHEIAHYLLHRDEIGSAGVIDSALYRSNLTSRKEAEANRMAADIVMPSVLVRDELAKRGGYVSPAIREALAARFGVSTQAMDIKLGVDR